MYSARPKLDQDTVPPSGILEKKAVDADSEIIRVPLVDDHKVMRQGLVSMIADLPSIQVAGEAGSGGIEPFRQVSPGRRSRCHKPRTRYSTFIHSSFQEFKIVTDSCSMFFT